MLTATQLRLACTSHPEEVTPSQGGAASFQQLNSSGRSCLPPILPSAELLGADRQALSLSPRAAGEEKRSQDSPSAEAKSRNKEAAAVCPPVTVEIFGF